MKFIFILSLADIVAGYIDVDGGGAWAWSGSNSARHACQQLLDPPANRTAQAAVVTTCLANNADIKAIVDAWPSGRKRRSASWESHGGGGVHGGGGGPGGGRPGGGGHGGGEGPYSSDRVADRLEALGYTEMATRLRKCVATANGYTNADGTFNVAALKAALLTAAAGATQLANIQLGLDGCPTYYLDSYKVHNYVECVINYCATGTGETSTATSTSTTTTTP
ncbi:cold shock protein 2 [Hyalella azteca]|uniref:Cold shock protein 2 n=1 Tax=Hyalella azteca TaxID=294128 RepID=A0A8B7NQQ1_HYAAZ|nr:cold shock protein 2 [Hyalella azteca]XP_018016016.1 cold shock protein 2 [Hyalella azteca]